MPPFGLILRQCWLQSGYDPAMRLNEKSGQSQMKIQIFFKRAA
jgi:hypothetical protein